MKRADNDQPEPHASYLSELWGNAADTVDVLLKLEIGLPTDDRMALASVRRLALHRGDEFARKDVH